MSELTRGSPLKLVLSLLAVVCVGGGQVLAQAADPMAGTTIETLGTFTPSVAGDSVLVLMRITMEPGTVIPAHQHPGAVVVVVEEGVYGTELLEGSGTLTRAGTTGEGASEVVSAGSEATLQPGDSFSYEGAVHTMANPGDEPLVLLVSALLDPAMPGFMFQ